jgi:hypothetical protein
MELWETRQQQLLEFLTAPGRSCQAKHYENLFIQHYMEEAVKNEQIYKTLDVYFQGAVK